MIKRQTSKVTILATLLTLAASFSSAHADSVQWRQNLDAAKIEATQTNRLLLVHFGTKTCGPCRMLEQNVFSLPQVGTAIEKDYVPVKVDADLSPALSNAYRIDRVPTDVLLSPQGTVLARLSCPGTADTYLAQLAKAAQHFKKLAPSQNPSRQPQMQSAYAGLQINQHASASPQINQNVQTQSPTPSNPQLPAVTNNPYITSSQSTTQAHPNTITHSNPIAPAPSQSVAPNRYTPAVPPRTAATVPPTAMQSSYNRGPRSAASQNASATPPAIAKPREVSPSVQMASAQSTVPPQPQITVPQIPPTSASLGSSVNSGNKPDVGVRTTSKVPTGSPPLAFDGCCPVTLKVNHKWVRGDVNFGAYHRGRTFLFAGPEQQRQFLANPDAYSPVFSGLDVVRLLEKNERVEGIRKYGFKYLDAFYLFSSEETMSKFATNPAYYSAGVRQAMLRMDSTTSGTIRR